MSKKKIILIVILSILIACTLFFIWGNSFASKTQSTQQSDKVYESVKPTLDTVFGKDKITPLIFRKSAHCIEFMLLSVEVFALIFVINGFDVKWFFNGYTMGLFVAVTDETIQNFTGRGPSIIDVLIDFGGYTFSAICMAILGVIITKRLKRKLKTKEK